jgi:hypothetical protein
MLRGAARAAPQIPYATLAGGPAVAYDRAMQLRNARLCLNCEEIHAAAHCPVCASESFAFVSRWIPAEERRRDQRPRPAAPPPSSQNRGHGRWVKRGAAGVAVIAASRLLWQLSRPVQWSSDVPEEIDSENGSD